MEYPSLCGILISLPKEIDLEMLDKAGYVFVYNTYCKASHEIITKLNYFSENTTSVTDEFQIGCILHNLYASLRVNKEQGPDFKLDDLGIKLYIRYLGYIFRSAIILGNICC